MGSRKGFALSIDALLSVSILAMFLFAFAYLSSSPQSDSFVSLIMKKQAMDLLLVMDKNGAFASMDVNQINQTIRSTLPYSFAYQLDVVYYNNSDHFESLNNLTVLRNSTSSSYQVSASRDFVIKNGSVIAGYGTAGLRLWSR